MTSMDLEAAPTVFVAAFILLMGAAVALKPITGANLDLKVASDPRCMPFQMVDGKEKFDLSKKEYPAYKKLQFALGIINGLLILSAGCVDSDLIQADPVLLGFRNKILFRFGIVAVVNHLQMLHDRTVRGVQYGRWPVLLFCFMGQMLFVRMVLSYLHALDNALMASEQEEDSGVTWSKRLLMSSMAIVGFANLMRVVIIPLKGGDYFFEPKDKKVKSK